MKIISALLLSAALVAGAVGSAAAYRHQSDRGPAPVVAVAAKSPPAAQVVRPGTHFVWAPCPAGSELERGACVTDVVRTVVIPAPVAPAVASAPAATALAAPVLAAPALAAPALAAPPAAQADDGQGAGTDDTGDGGDDGGESRGGARGGDD